MLGPSEQAWVSLEVEYHKSTLVIFEWHQIKGTSELKSSDKKKRYRKLVWHAVWRSKHVRNLASHQRERRDPK